MKQGATARGSMNLSSSGAMVPHISEQVEAKRLFVRIGDRHVPLFEAQPILDSLKSPWHGLILEKHHHMGCEIPVHDHETLCLHLQTGGQVDMEWFCSGKSGMLRSTPGSMMLLPAGTRDSVIWHGSAQRIVAGIEPALLKNAAEQMEIKGFCDFNLRWAFRDQQLEMLLVEMNREMRSGWSMGGLYGDLLGMALSVALIRRYGELSTRIPPAKGGLSRLHLNRVLTYIEENLNKEIRLEDLAELNSISRFHFARSFRDSLGETPYQFILKKRVQRAKALLQLPRTSIAEIAKISGFSDASQFTRMFRKITGVTPQTWRRNA
ncbi:helix-turn-helix domain-containing protein [Acidicapsa ligni]|uniref:helix-turn-helix domain-containing protein n=1 Tax=Acidicapsa ligni TaxID=542300 RepID=UPI0021DF74C7|nr:AraC family transcriptional regulator [Acidicapsa ligni]